MGEMVLIAMTIVAIVLITGLTLNGIVDKVMQGKRLRHDARPPADPHSPGVREIAERQQMIEDRLRVLERIATDRGSLLADEIEALRRQCGPDFVLMVPGIRPVGSAANDQKRAMTPRQAVDLGATNLVVGRPIYQAQDPRAAAEKIAAAATSLRG